MFIDLFLPKVGLSPSKKCFICFTESSVKMMKNAFRFILKAISFSRYFNFCPDFLISRKNGLMKKNYDVTTWLTNNCN